MANFLEVVDRVPLTLFLLVQVLNKNSHGGVDVTQDDATKDLCEDRKNPS